LDQRILMKKLLPLILILFAAPCFGEFTHYKCTIKTFYDVNEKDGLLVESKAGPLMSGRSLFIYILILKLIKWICFVFPILANIYAVKPLNTMMNSFSISNMYYWCIK